MTFCASMCALPVSSVPVAFVHDQDYLARAYKFLKVMLVHVSFIFTFSLLQDPY